MTREFKVPEIGENVDAATVAKVLISKGETIRREQSVVELETDKAVMEVPSDVEGTVEDIRVKQGDEVKVGQTLFTVKEEAGPAQSAEPIPAAPSVRRLARETGLDLRNVAGSGPDGRIGIEDVKAHAGSQGQGVRLSATRAEGGAATPLPDLAQWGEVDREAMSNVRRLTADRMSHAWSVIPHVTQFGKADVTEMERLRGRYKGDAEKAGGRLTLMVILIKTVAGALKAFPRFNAGFDPERHEIVYRKYCNIGIAMDTDRGLVVPVIRDVDEKNMIEISVDLRGISDKARAGKLAVEDMRGGCFTVSNAGALGGDVFTPIVNWPEVAILGMAKTRTEAVHRAGAFVPRLMLPLSLSFDHRVIDGADGVRFMRWLIDAIEEPVKLLWEG